MSVVENLYRRYTKSGQKLLTFIEYYYFYFYAYMEETGANDRGLDGLNVKDIHNYIENLIVKEVKPDNWLLRFYRRFTGVADDESGETFTEEYDCILPYTDPRELLTSVVFSPFLEGYVPGEGRIEKIDRFLVEAAPLLDKKSAGARDLELLIQCYNKYLGSDDDRILFIDTAEGAVRSGLVESNEIFTIAPRLRSGEEDEEALEGEEAMEGAELGYGGFGDQSSLPLKEEEMFSWENIFHGLSERMNLQIVVRFEKNFGYPLEELDFDDRNQRLDLFSWIEFLNFARSLAEGERVEDKLEEGYESWEKIWNPEVIFTPDIFSAS